MDLVVYNTLTRHKEPFEPLEPGHVRMYVCGPTVYDEPHIGHARAAIAFDVIRRTLEAAGLRVTYVQNITDVDDKIIQRAAEQNRTPWEVADEYTRAYDDAMRALGVRPPNSAPRATGHIAEMLALTSALIERGVAYESGGDVYFAVERFAEYGRLSNRTLEEMRAGDRVDPDPRKRDPYDFALWKSAKPGEPSWPSPWGPGRPGWHIECSAMSMKYLGETFDIHGGGLDLIFPHHENEIAQSVCGSAGGFARVWLHNGFVTIEGEKMSKSLGNFVTVRDVLARAPAPVVRYLLAAAHYRTPLDFSEQGLEDARGAWRRLATFRRNADEVVGATLGRPDGIDADTGGAEGWREKFLAAMSDDFNAPEAIAVLFDLVSTANPLVERGDSGELLPLLITFDELTGVLGLNPAGGAEARAGADLAPLVDYLLRLREEARGAKDFKRADEIRSVLGSAGVVVEDKPGGPRWYLTD